MLYLPPETERVRNQAGVQLPTQLPPERNWSNRQVNTINRQSAMKAILSPCIVGAVYVIPLR